MSEIGFGQTERRVSEEAAFVTSGSISSEVRGSQACKGTINHGTFPASQASTQASHTGETKGAEANWLKKPKKERKKKGRGERLNPVT